jgi:hypothetical protein
LRIKNWNWRSLTGKSLKSLMMNGSKSLNLLAMPMNWNLRIGN